MPELTGITLDDKRLSLRDFRDQGVLVVYWSTNCPVCRANMRELRANLAGWDGQPFTLLGVNLDDQRSEFQRYEAIVEKIVKPEQRFTSIWGFDASYKDTLGGVQRLPSSVLINKQGQVVHRYKGRIPVSAWDDIAELL
jgi:peroxiredoxin